MFRTTLASSSLLLMVSCALVACGGESTPQSPAEPAQLGEAASPLVWAQQQTLLASDGTENDRYGAAVALDGDTAVVGAPIADGGGGAYVLVRSGDTWVEEAKLTSADLEPGDWFGSSVAIDGDTIVVGASNESENGEDAGAAYVFVRSNGSWSQQQKLLASDGAAGDELGCSVGISGERIVVGAWLTDQPQTDAGSAYVFDRDGDTWTQVAELQAGTGGQGPEDHVGWAVAVSGDTVLVSAPDDDHFIPAGVGYESGTVYVFVRNSTSWSIQATLFAKNAQGKDRFGSAVALDGDTALIGAYRKGNMGSGYVFVRDSSTWTQQSTLVPSDGATFDDFGSSVALSGDIAVLGSPGDDDLGSYSGGAYVFIRDEGAWWENKKLLASDGAASDRFGGAVAISGDTAIVGAWRHEVDMAPVGAAYVSVVYDVGQSCSADGECSSGFCVDGVCCNSACGGDVDDDCQACSVGAGAAVDGLCSALSSVPCSDGTFCNGTETCNAGVCGDSTGDPCAGPDGDEDCSETCDESAQSCAAPDPDGSACPGGLCSAGSCELEEAAGGAGGQSEGGAGAEGGTGGTSSAGNGGTSSGGTGGDPGGSGSGGAAAGGAPSAGDASTSTGSGCSAAPGADNPWQAFVLLGLGALLRRRRRDRR